MAIVQVNQTNASEGIGWTKPADYDVVANAANPIGGIRSLHPGVFSRATPTGERQPPRLIPTRTRSPS